MARKKQTGVTLEPEVIAYLDDIANSEERTRSQVISRIIREHANRQGKPISPDGNSSSPNAEAEPYARGKKTA